MPSFCRMFARCRSTVLTLITSVSAISLEECPSAISLTTSSSRGVRMLSGQALALPAAPQVVPDQRGDRAGVEERLAAHRRPAGLHQVLVGDRLQHVAGRPGLERLEEVLLVVVHRQHQDAHRRAPGGTSPGRPAARSSAAWRCRGWPGRRRRARPARPPRRRRRPRRPPSGPARRPGSAAARGGPARGRRPAGSGSGRAAVVTLRSSDRAGRPAAPRCRRRAAGRRSRSAPIEDGPLAHAPDAGALGRAAQPAPVVGDAQQHAVRARAVSASSHPGGAGVPGDVGQALLRDPVEHQLHVPAQRRQPRVQPAGHRHLAGLR